MAQIKTDETGKVIKNDNKNKFRSIDEAANTVAPASLSTPPAESSSGLPWGILLASVVASVCITYGAALIYVIGPLEAAVDHERIQKISYITSDQLDFKTIAPRIRELEISNAAKARKELVLIETIEALGKELTELRVPFEDVVPVQ